MIKSLGSSGGGGGGTVTSVNGDSGPAVLLALSGDVTSSAGSLAGTIPVGTVTDAKGSLTVKPSATVVATTNQTLSGTPTIDGQATAAGSIILLTAQSAGAENGPWVAAAGAWARPAWYASGNTTQAFQFITTFVRLGTSYQGTTWRQTATGPITIDTTATTWTITPLALNTNTVTGTVPLTTTNFATPTGSVGLTAVAGSATTATRSDGTAALDVTITPSWTGNHTWSKTNPRALFNDTSGGTNGKLYAVDVTPTQFQINTRTDVDGTGQAILTAVRAAASTTITSITYGNSTSNPSHAFGGTGQVTGGGLLQFPRLSVTGTSIPPIGVYAPAASTLGLSANTLGQLWIDTKTGVRKSGITISASERCAVGGITYTNTTQTGNTAATETDAFSHTLSAATLGTDGESIEFEAAGTFAATASTDKRVKVVFGSTTIFDTGALAAVAAASWHLKGLIVRTGAATQKVIVSFDSSFSSLNSTATYTAATETLANALTLKLTVNGTNANDTVGQFYKEKWFPFM